MKSPSPFLNADPTPVLLDSAHPSIRLAALRELIGVRDDADEVAEARRAVEASGYAATVRRSMRNGVMGNAKRFDLFTRGAMWHLAVATAMGFDRRHDFVEATAELLLSRSQMPDGGFTLTWRPATSLACRTGDMLRALISGGYASDERIARGIAWLRAHQRHDGGWLHCPEEGRCDAMRLLLFGTAGAGLRRETSSDVSSCPVATFACADAIDRFTGRIDGPHDESLARAAEFFLGHHLFARPRRTDIPNWYEHGRTSCWTSLGYPIMQQYDILAGLAVIAAANRIEDARCGEAFNTVIERQEADGTWAMENFSTGMLFDGKRTHDHVEARKWTTLRVLVFLKRAGYIR